MSELKGIEFVREERTHGGVKGLVLKVIVREERTHGGVKGLVAVAEITAHQVNSKL